MLIKKINKKTIEKIKDFAHKRCQNIGLYKKRGGFKYIDIVVGAMGEFAAHYVIPDCSKPDLEIYDNKNKSFDEDLYDTKGRCYHIKSQSKKQADKYGHSWLMQKEDPILREPKNGHYLVLTCVHLEEEKVEILACIPIRTVLRYNLLNRPKLEHLLDKKYALYLDEIKDVLDRKSMWSVLNDNR